MKKNQRYLFCGLLILVLTLSGCWNNDKVTYGTYSGMPYEVVNDNVPQIEFCNSNSHLAFHHAE